MHQLFLSRRPLRAGAIVLLSLGTALPATSVPALSQAYTYDPPTCDGTWRDEPGKPQELRVVWEMTAAQACVQQNKTPLACRHLQAGIAAADRMGADAGNPDGVKSHMKSMMRTHGCP